jgi:hypothetical protein
MKRTLILLSLGLLSVQPALAQTRGGFGSAYGGVGAGSPYAGRGSSYGGVGAGSPYGYMYGSSYGGVGAVPYSGMNPNGVQNWNPYNANANWNPYGNRYVYGANGALLPAGFGNPISLGNGFYSFTGGGYRYNMWHAPSGYYYPWLYATSGGYGPIIQINNGAAQATFPPISTVFTDMTKYLDEQKDKGKLSDSDYSHLKQRAVDLLSKERDLRSQGGGTIDPEVEQSIRADMDSLGGEIAQRVKL